MLFNSIPFLIFFPLVVLLYFLIPHRFRYIWLLLVSYYYYMYLNPKYALLLMASTLITYFGGMLIYQADTAKRKKLYVALSVVLNLSMLVFFKYANFLLDGINTLFSIFGGDPADTRFNLMLPVGISFYTFQSLSYIMDSYRGEVKPEKNILKYALFVSFFPNILAGPIERSKNLLPQFEEKHFFDYTRVRDGLILMLWGYFQKVVIASRLQILTDLVYGNIEDYTGITLVIGIFCYGLQIYCDFASYSNIAIGAAKVMGFHLMTNFRQPFFSKSVKEFWRRWHISLNTWFVDYLYIPLGGSRVKRWRKYFNVMIVFLSSGLWHGASMTYIMWGLINGIFQIASDLLKPFRTWTCKILHYDFNNRVGKAIRISFTFILFHISLVFFCAHSVAEAFEIFRRMFTGFSLMPLFDGTIYSLGLGTMNLYILIFSLIILLIVDLVFEKKDAFLYLAARPAIVRWGFYYLLISMVLLSCNLSTQEFLYMNF